MKEERMTDANPFTRDGPPTRGGSIYSENPEQRGASMRDVSFNSENPTRGTPTRGGNENNFTPTRGAPTRGDSSMRGDDGDDNDDGNYGDDNAFTNGYQNDTPGPFSRAWRAVWTRMTGHKVQFQRSNVDSYCETTPDYREETKLAPEEMANNELGYPQTPEEHAVFGLKMMQRSNEEEIRRNDEAKRRNDIDEKHLRLKEKQIELDNKRNELEQKRLDLVLADKKKKTLDTTKIPIATLGDDANPFNADSAKTFVKQVLSLAELLDYDLQYLVKLTGGIVLLKLQMVLNKEDMIAGRNEIEFNKFLSDLLTDAPAAPSIQDEEKALNDLDVSMLEGPKTLANLEIHFAARGTLLMRHAKENNMFALNILKTAWIAAVPYQVGLVISSHEAMEDEDNTSFQKIVKISKRVETQLKRGNRWAKIIQDMANQKSRRGANTGAHSQAFVANVPSDLVDKFHAKNIPEKFWATIVQNPNKLDHWVPFGQRAQCPKCTKFMPFGSQYHKCPGQGGQPAANVAAATEQVATSNTGAITFPSKEAFVAMAKMVAASSDSDGLAFMSQLQSNLNGPQGNIAYAGDENMLDMLAPLYIDK
eukprot:CAMPEP_0197304892 /NCGR_PEP_ID=MMETSP0891-20130614/530_1 /TAXON_ID=44058 ORGANISM="Aureoumbra lagunensis, Strain CCMP1510" /NCGR_SAMPLE_ID=MMETSP0891 /ASSEMBLY_ACC=CAM_ASM_000534 /LENGTH=590 /DNA_ID=CAMNT_0042785263 /DNA_START=1769 /DNA_END=3541 /DNA_ORIENTATION=+